MKVKWSEAKWKRILKASIPRWFPGYDPMIKCAFCGEIKPWRTKAHDDGMGYPSWSPKCQTCPALELCVGWINNRENEPVRTWLRLIGKIHHVPMPKGKKEAEDAK